jgi:hypothetical protein
MPQIVSQNFKPDTNKIFVNLRVLTYKNDTEKIKTHTIS